MTHQSTPELLVLRSVRLVGFADSDAVTERAGTCPAEALRVLSAAEQAGWVQHVTFADLNDWSLPDSGKAENERQLAAERMNADSTGVVAAVYHEFLSLNARLLRAVTDWQTKPNEADEFAPNHHLNRAWDGRVLEELTALGRKLALLNKKLIAVLTRFAAPRRGTIQRYTGPKWGNSTGSTRPTSIPASGSGSNSTKTSSPHLASTAERTVTIGIVVAKHRQTLLIPSHGVKRNAWAIRQFLLP